MHRWVAGMLVAITLLGCPGFAPISTQLPPEAKIEHIYLAVLEDYLIFSKDVNALVSLPSTTREEAEAVDKVMDHADAQIHSIDTALANGQTPNYALATVVLNTAIREICAQYSDEVPSCAGRN